LKNDRKTNPTSEGLKSSWHHVVSEAGRNVCALSYEIVIVCAESFWCWSIWGLY